MNGKGNPVFGSMDVATPILINDWMLTSAAIPVAIYIPFLSPERLATLIHCNTMSSKIAIIITLPMKPNSSHTAENIKSVCCSDMRFVSFTVATSELLIPLPVNCPDPMAMIELFC